MLFKRKPFTVQLSGKAGIIYKEQGKVMFIDSELLSGAEFDIVVYTDSISQWEPPYHAEAIDEKEKERIKLNVASALRQGRIEWHKRLDR